MVTATANGNQMAIPGTEEVTNDDHASEKPKRVGNPLMRAIQPDYITDPRPLDFVDNMMSDDFCTEVANRLLLQRLQYKTEKEWLNFCKRVWTWAEQAEQREAEAQVNQLLQQYKDNPKVLEALKRKLEE